MPVSEYTAELTELADIALRMARKDLQKTKGIRPFFVFRKADGGMEEFIVPEKYADLMDIGDAKTVLFNAVREIVQAKGATAVIFASDAWRGKATPAGMAAPREEFNRLAAQQEMQAAIDKGWIERVEAIIVMVQTPQRIMLVWQNYERDGTGRVVKLAEKTVTEMACDEFGGRLKMYGDLREENLR